MTLGSMHAASFKTDPKHLGFVLARYKFVAKMLAGYRNVLEIGCGDGTGAAVVRPEVGAWFGIDREPLSTMGETWDILHGPPPISRVFDGIYALDVLEHIGADVEHLFFQHAIAAMTDDGTMIVGMPSKESQPYASEHSRLHHVNCKTEDELRATMERHFRRVFLFGMNDEMLHTGFGPMCHYRFALATGRRI